MPEFKVTAPDGSTYKVTAPEGATDAQIQAYVESQVGKPSQTPQTPSFPAVGPMVAAKGKDYISPQERAANVLPESVPKGLRDAYGYMNALPEMFVRGATAGLSDYAQAGADQLVGALGGNDRTFNESLQNVRGGVREFQSANPVTGYGAEIAGSVYSPIYRAVGSAASGVRSGMGVFDRIARYFAQGAATGAVGGAGYAQDTSGGLPSLSDLAFSTGISAAVGAPLAVASGLVVEGGGALFNWIRDRVASRVSPPSQGSFGGPSAPPAPQSPPNQGAFGNAPTPPVQDPSQWRRPPQDARDVAAKIVARAAERDNLTDPRLAAKLNQLGEQGTIADTGPNMQTLAMTAAQQPGTGMQTVNRNLGGRAAGRETRLVDNVLGDIRQRYSGLVDSLQAQRSADAAPLYELAFAPQTGPATTRSKQITSPLINRLLDDSDVQKGIATGIRLIEKEASVSGNPVNYADYALRRNPETGQFERFGTPTLRLLDAAKRGLDEMLFQGDGLRNQYGRLNQMGRAVEGQRAALVRELDRLTVDPATGVSAYQQARNAWAGPSAQLEAAGNGRAWLSDDMDDVSRMIRRMGDSEREAYVIGMMRDVEERLQKNPNAALKLMQSTMAQRRMQMILPKAEYNSLRQTIAREAKMLATERATLGGSQTALREAARNDVNNQISDIGDAALSVARGRGVGSIFDRALDYFNRPTEQVVNELARMTTSRNPAERAAALERIAAARQQMAIQQQQIQSLANRGAVAPITATAPLRGQR